RSFQTVDVQVTSCCCSAQSLGARLNSRISHSIGERSVYVRFFHVTVSDSSPNLSVGGSGLSGFSSGRASSEGPDGSDSPTALVAVTVNVYTTSFCSPLTVQVVEAHSVASPRP